MKFSDLFVPKYLHSDPEVRKSFVSRLDDKNSLSQMSRKDQDETVRDAAIARLNQLRSYKQTSA